MEGTGDTRSGSAAGFRILFVCTGNICRSPVAERLARSALGPSFHVTSAGTRAQPGMEMTERAKRVLLGLGGDPGGFVSRPLTGELLAGADLVLTAAVVHRAEAVMMHLPAAARTFTIAEFADLSREVPAALVTGQDDPVGRARALVEQARALRGLVRVDQPDIPDPIGGTRRAYRAAGRRIAESLAIPLRLLTHQPVS